MSATDAKVALQAAAVSALSGWTIKVENAPFTVPAGKWAHIHGIIEDSRIALTIGGGAGNLDSVVGHFQIDLNYVAGTGFNTKTDEDAVQGAFKCGTRLSSSGQVVTIRRCYNRFRDDSDRQFFTVGMIVEWEALTPR